MRQLAIFFGGLFLFYVVGIVWTNWETFSRLWQ